MNDKELDKLFSDQLKDQEASPDPKIWEQIEAELDRSSKKPVVRKLSWLKYAALLVVTLGIALLLNSRFAQKPVPLDSLAQVTAEKLVPESTTSSKDSAPLEGPKLASTSMQSGSALTTPSKEEKGAQDVALRDKPARQALEKPMHTAKKLALPSISLAAVKLSNAQSLTSEKIIRRKVVEVEAIRPLVDLDEGEETMLASNSAAPNQNIVSGILNKLSNAINTDEQKVVRFSHDDEGSFHIDINNSFAKNRFKRKK